MQEKTVQYFSVATASHRRQSTHSLSAMLSDLLRGSLNQSCHASGITMYSDNWCYVFSYICHDGSSASVLLSPFLMSGANPGNLKKGGGGRGVQSLTQGNLY